MIWMINMRRYGSFLFILFLALVSYFWLSTNNHTQSATPAKKESDPELAMLLSKSPSYKEMYKGIVSKSKSSLQGKVFISYLEALRTNDEKKLRHYLPDRMVKGEKDLVSFYQAIDYATLNLGEVIPKEKSHIIDIQLFYSVNGVKIGKRLELHYGSNNEVSVYETKDLYLGSSKPENLDPVVAAILSQFGKWMDYQPAETSIIEYNSEGLEYHIAYNYPLLLSLRTVKKIDALSYDKPYIYFGLEGVTLLVSKSENKIQAELNGRDRYLLKAGDKEWQAIQEYAIHSKPVDGREIIWNQLISAQKARVNGSWEDANVSTLIFNQNMINSQKAKSYDGKEVYVFSFPTKEKGNPHNMIIYADIDTLEYIGQGLVDVREVVWGQLSTQQKERLTGTWKDGKISKITLTKDMMSQIKDNSYEGKEVYLINFPTTDKFEPNVIAVYADPSTFKYIGDALVQ